MKRRIGWLEIFICALFLFNGLLLLPGTQSFRFAIRAAPYVLSLAACVWRRRRNAANAPGATAMQLGLLVLVAGLLNPHTQPAAGVAQILFQFAIVCPVFWAAELIQADAQLIRLLRLIFVCNAIGAGVGLLQVYFPERFLPAEFSSSAGSSWLESMTFIAPDGRTVVRPPGLSDLPGGAAVAGSLTAVLGLAFSSVRNASLWKRGACLAAASIGISVLYLTQVRSLALMTLIAVAVLALFAMRRPQVWNRAWMAGAAMAVIAGAFTWAVALGGADVRDRFLDLNRRGLAASYDASRGWFWRYTFGQALDAYPLGAGLGRWGMMQKYFGEADRPDAPELWAEIQLTGWLYDGGVALWVIYGAGLAASMLFIFRMAVSKSYGHAIPFAAALIFCINLNVIGASFTGPSFNTTLGMQYWLGTALLCGAARATRRLEAS